jgi:tetratricopeptide (TPR) repeat protein
MRQVVSASVNLWIALGSWLLTASTTLAQNQYAVVHIENSTSDLTVRYRVRWGANAEWSAEWVLKPRRWNYHWYHYPAPDQNSSPTPEIRFVSGIKRDRSWTTLSLQAYASPVQDDNGRRYSFIKLKDNSGEEYVDLRAWSRETEQAFALFHQGLSQYKQGGYAAAIERFTKAIQAQASYVDALNYRGLSYSQLGDYDRAVADYTEAIRLKPRYYMAYNNRGYAWLDQREYEKAIEDFSAARGIEPKDAFSYHGLAETELAQGAYDRTITECTKAIQLNTKYAAAYNTRGLAYFKKGDTVHALPDFSEAIRIDSGYSRAYTNRAGVYFTTGRYDLAIDDSTKAIELSPKSARSYWWRSRAFAKKGQDAAAKADYEEALRRDPAQERVLEIAASNPASAEGGDREEALRALRSFKLGSTLTPKRLRELNDFPNVEPLDKPVSPLPAEVQDLIRNERIKHALLEQEMIAAADKFLTAATLRAKERAAKGLRLSWLYGPVTSPLRRENSVDDLGGVRLIGHLESDDIREINVIFPITYHASDRNYESKGGPVLLWGGDNCRLEARLFSTGSVRADYAYQSFSIGTEKGAAYMRPGLYLDEKTGVLVNRYITSKALGTSCMDCHSKGPNFKSEDIKLMEIGDLTSMPGFNQFLDQAYHLGATKPELRELRERMAADPASLLPLMAYRKANEESWVQRYPQFAKKPGPDQTRP